MNNPQPCLGCGRDTHGDFCHQCGGDNYDFPDLELPSLGEGPEDSDLETIMQDQFEACMTNFTDLEVCEEEPADEIQELIKQALKEATE